MVQENITSSHLHFVFLIVTIEVHLLARFSASIFPLVYLHLKENSLLLAGWAMTNHNHPLSFSSGIFFLWIVDFLSYVDSIV